MIIDLATNDIVAYLVLLIMGIRGASCANYVIRPYKVIRGAFSNYVAVESFSSIIWLLATVEPGKRLNRS